MVRYRFDHFVLSPRRRLLTRDGRGLPLIPRYFDLLVLLIEHRREAVHKRDIFDRVWADVVVSDSALSQAIRTIRRTLGDDSREPRFIRTVSRHGYQFVFTEVVEESDDTAPIPVPPAPPAAVESAAETGAQSGDPYEPLLERLTRSGSDPALDEDRREAAELLHALGTSEALERLATRPGFARGRALLRDTRWDAPSEARVPILGGPAPILVARELVALRLRRAARMLARRWAGASLGAGLAGIVGGMGGALILAAIPESHTSLDLVPVLAVIGGVCAALGGAGVAAGLTLAEASARSWKGSALLAGGALGGGCIGTIVQWLGRWSLEALVGVKVAVGGGLEGVVIGAAAGVGYALATRQLEGGMAAPRGRQRLYAASLAALLCGFGGLALTISGRPLVGGTIHVIAQAARGSKITLAPLGQLIGEADFGPLSQAIVGFCEAALFGFGLALGQTRRPRT